MTFLDILQMHELSKNKTTPRVSKQQTYHRRSKQQEPPKRPRIELEPPKRQFTNYKNQFSYLTDLAINIDDKNATKSKTAGENRQSIVRLKESELIKKIEQIRNSEFRKISEDFTTDEKQLKPNETTLVFQPKSKAEAGRNGVALSTPISHAVLFPGQKANIHFEPESVASAGPGGFAHAHSDLFVTYLQNSESHKNNQKTGK